MKKVQFFFFFILTAISNNSYSQSGIITQDSFYNNAIGFQERLSKENYRNVRIQNIGFEISRPDETANNTDRLQISNSKQTSLLYYRHIYNKPPLNDTFINHIQHLLLTNNKAGLIPSIYYSNEDRFYVGLGYRFKYYKPSTDSLTFQQFIDLHYSLTEKAFSLTYTALFPNLIAKSDLSILANYDLMRWDYYFGLGNDRPFENNNIKYYTARTRQWIIQPALTRIIGMNRVSIYANIQGIRVIDDSDNFVGKNISVKKTGFDWQTFAGLGVTYSYQNLNDPVVPEKGVYFNADIHGSQNLKQTTNYVKYSGEARFYIPLISKFSLDLRTGAATVTGNPEFYQYATIGGPTLRGYKRERFYGKTAFYNTNDLRFITPFKTRFINGKIGLLAFFDNGRVWMPGEQSDTWHTGYGGGLILSPFNALYGEVTYGSSKDGNVLQVRLTTYLKQKKK